MTKALELEDVSVRLGNKPIVNSISFQLNQGEIGCLLGASGCGKTTLLRAIAGFEQPVNGKIWLNEQYVSDDRTFVPVEQRQVGMVFQDYALFPHLTVWQNIAFGLDSWERHDIEARVQEISTLLEVNPFLLEYPHRLSGGQQQRVAIARAMAPRPRILLLDEPFASMDVELREQIARQIRAVLKQEGITSVLVSHNQLEAFAMADEIGVIHEGKLLQWDNAFNLYHRPACAYIADFIGEGVLLPGMVLDDSAVETELGKIDDKEVHGLAAGIRISVLLRPDDVIHDDTSETRAIVVDKAFRGAEFLYTLRLQSGAEIISLVPSHHDYNIGELMGIRLSIKHLVIFHNETGTTFTEN